MTGRLMASTLWAQQKHQSEGSLTYSLESHQYERLTDFGEWPVWLPDSRRVLFVANGKDFYVVDSSSKQVHKVFSARPRHHRTAATHAGRQNGVLLPSSDRIRYLAPNSELTGEPYLESGHSVRQCPNTACLSGLPKHLERCRLRHPHPQASQGGALKIAVICWNPCKRSSQSR